MVIFPYLRWFLLLFLDSFLKIIKLELIFSIGSFLSIKKEQWNDRISGYFTALLFLGQE